MRVNFFNLQIELNYPHETLVFMKGHFGLISTGSPVIRSLTFETSEKKKFSNLCRARDSIFVAQQSARGHNQIGFHGRSG